jgi:hypothetical protein
MMRRIATALGTFVLVILVAIPALAQPEIRINEVYYRGADGEDWIELKNMGTEALDVSQYWLYAEGTFSRIDALTLLSGDDLVVQPQEIIQLESWRDLNNSVADVSIFVDEMFNSPISIRDFVCWGGTVGRYEVAVTAGVWGELQQLPVAFDGQSSQWKGVDSGPGSATQAIDWVRDVPTPGDENTGRVAAEGTTVGQLKSRF